MPPSGAPVEITCIIMYNVPKKWVWTVAGILGGLIVLLVVFRIGMFVGEKQANFTERWGANYGRFFGEPRSGFFGEAQPGNGAPLHAFGNAGSVLSVASGSIVMETSDNVEKTVIVSSSTIIRDLASTVGIEDLRAGDPIVVIGDPGDNGAIDARLIRVFPSGSMPSFPGSSSGTPSFGMMPSR